jgi:hypothetical protein
MIIGKDAGNVIECHHSTIVTRVAGWRVDKFKNGALSCVDGSLFASLFLK